MFPIAHGESSLKFACFKIEMLFSALLKIFHFIISTKPSDELFLFSMKYFPDQFSFETAKFENISAHSLRKLFSDICTSTYPLRNAIQPLAVSFKWIKHRLTILCLCGGLCIYQSWLCPFITLAKLKPKFRSFKTEENEIKTHKIAAMVFWFVFLRFMRILIEDFVDAVGSHGCYRRFTDHMKRCEI